MSVLTTERAGLAQVTSPAPWPTWAAIVADDPAALADHTPAWVDAMAATGPWKDASRLYELTDGRQFVLPLVRRTGVTVAAGIEASFPDGWGIGGLVGRDLNRGALGTVLADLAGRREVLTRVRPDPLHGELWAAATPTDAYCRPRCAHVLDLSGGLDGVRAGLHRSTRRSIAKAERAGLRVTDSATPAHLAAYYGLFELSLRRWAARSREPLWLAQWRGTRRDPLDKLATMAELLGDRFRLWMAWEDDHPVAGAIVLLGNAAHATRGAMDRERNAPTRATYLLEWLAISEAIVEGNTSYHLGETGTTSSLAGFKEGFGARPVPYADVTFERLPLTRADRALRTVVKRAIGFRDGE